MKTPEQIKAWLEAQPWYEQFKNYTLDKNVNLIGNEEYLKLDSAMTLSGVKGVSTITGAFIWRLTKEGVGCWADINFIFNIWYHEENPD